MENGAVTRRARSVALLAVAGLILAAAGCGGDGKVSYEPALTELDLALKALAQLEKRLPDSGFDDNGLGEYADHTIRPLAEGLREEIEKARLALADPDEYEFLHDVEVDDFIRGAAWADAQRFRGDVLALQEDLERADAQLSEIEQLNYDIGALIGYIEEGEYPALGEEEIVQLDQLQTELRSLRSLYENSLGLDIEGVRVDDLPESVQRELQGEDYVSVEDLQPAFAAALEAIDRRYEEMR